MQSNEYSPISFANWIRVISLGVQLCCDSDDRLGFSLQHITQKQMMTHLGCLPCLNMNPCFSIWTHRQTAWKQIWLTFTSGDVRLYLCFHWQVYENRGNEKTFNEDMIDTKTDTICIGKIPVMVNSSFCHLHGLTEKELVARGHCAFDSGGYFIIKGSEKVRLSSSIFSGMNGRYPRCQHGHISHSLLGRWTQEDHIYKNLAVFTVPIVFSCLRPIKTTLSWYIWRLEYLRMW